MSVNKARLVRGILGDVGVGGGLEKLTISYEKYDTTSKKSSGEIEAQFNPAEISREKSATWAQQHSWASGVVTQAFRTVQAETLTVELFFDTYASDRAGVAWPHLLTSVMPANLTGAGSVRDVREETDRIAVLANVDSHTHRPPICKLRWGSRELFTGVLTKVNQRYTLFLEDGTPVRATVTCTFTESSTEARKRASELNSPDVHKTRQVRRSDSLHSLAAEEYGDSALWRHIARANGIVNPRDLRPGTPLVIPKLQS